MKLPKELQKNVDDLNSPSNRILVTILLITVVALYGNDYRSNSKLKSDFTELRGKYDSLQNSDLLKTEKELLKAQDDLMQSEAARERLESRTQWMDSIKHLLKKIK